MEKFENFSQIKKDFDFSETDEKRIKELKPVMEKYIDEFINKLYQFIFKLPSAKEYFKSEASLKRHKDKLREWYIELFDAEYDERYFEKLHKVGEIHDKLHIPSHYINATFNFIRRFFIEKLNQEFGYSRERNLYVEALGKLLDINLDILTKAYIEEEITRYGRLSKLEKKLLKISKRFADILDMALLIALVIMSMFAVGLFFYDIYELALGHVSIEKGIIKTLGSLLVIWAVAELMEEEIKHLQGGGFAITAFISVALAAIIRKILIVSLSPEDIKKLLAYGGVILILGIVYYLILKKEKDKISFNH